MKTKTNIDKGSLPAGASYRLTVKYLIISAFLLTGIQTSLLAQVPAAPFTKPSWWIGGAAGANFNFDRGTTQQLNADLTVPAAFHHGRGVGLFLAPLVEFHRPGSRWGIMLQAGYDSRRSSFREILTPCNCPADLSTNLGYLTVEPGLRFAPFRSGFYLFGGPRLAFNVQKSFTYSQKANPAYPEQVVNPDVTGDFSMVNKTLLSLQIGAGYDLPLSSMEKQTQVVFSPFVSFQPYFGQSPRSKETWTLTTLRIGAAFKFGRGHKNSSTAESEATDSEVRFSVNSPENIPAERQVRETFPLRNYVFFNIGSTEIPDRYVLLRKEQVKDFKEDRLEMFKPEEVSGRSERQMVAYYNVLNILGDRMGKNPATTITLVGSSEKGPADGRALAESVRQYLVGVFGIDASRISIEGRDKPKIPSEQRGGTLELDLLREGDRRVSIESRSPSLLMEFKCGPDAPLKPVEIVALPEAPLDSYVTFSAAGGEEPFTSWSLEIRDEKGKVQNFGPYTMQQVSIPGKSILGTLPEGNYQVAMTGQTKAGKRVKKETSVHMVLWTPPENEDAMRFSVIFEFNESKATRIYEKYLTGIVVPKIPNGGKVIIHGHTDIIGEETHNETLSLARANEVRDILERSLSKAGRTGITFEVHGFGEDQIFTVRQQISEERFL